MTCQYQGLLLRRRPDHLSPRVSYTKVPEQSFKTTRRLTPHTTPMFGIISKKYKRKLLKFSCCKVILGCEFGLRKYLVVISGSHCAKQHSLTEHRQSSSPDLSLSLVISNAARRYPTQDRMLAVHGLSELLFKRINASGLPPEWDPLGGPADQKKSFIRTLPTRGSFLGENPF